MVFMIFLQFGLEVDIDWALLLVSLVNVLFCVGCVSRSRGLSRQ